MLDIGCNAGFYSIEMKRRGADARGRASTATRATWPRRASPPRSAGLEIEFRQLSVYDVAQLGERFDLVLFMGVLYHLRHPLLALDLIHEHVARDLLVFQSMQRGSAEVDARGRRLPVLRGRAIFDSPGYPEAALRRAALRRRPDQLVGPEPRLRRGHAAQRRLRRSSSHPEEEVYVCRRREVDVRPDGPQRRLSGPAEERR